MYALEHASGFWIAGEAINDARVSNGLYSNDGKEPKGAYMFLAKVFCTKYL